MTKTIAIGEFAPNFCLPDKDNKNVCLNDFRGRGVVLYFYPRDNTSGCTAEALGFSGALGEFEQMNAVIVGVSPDSVESHRKFIEKKGIRVTLLSDVGHKVLERYGVWQQKKLYGREFWGVVRSTFLIDPTGKISYVWRRVRVRGHVEEVKEKLKRGV